MSAAVPNCRRSKWTIRNGSANVAAILRPKYYDIEAESEDLNPKNYFLASNTCYCNDKSIEPVLFKRPKSCTCFIEQSQSNSFESDIDWQLTDDSSEPYCCQAVQNGGHHKAPNRSSITSKSDSCSGSDICHVDSANKRPCSSKTLATFRKSHYFDTHSVETLTKSIPEHECVHKLEFDERNLARSVNTDVYGDSRCVLCDKPMPESMTTLSTVGKSSKPKPESMTTLSTVSKSAKPETMTTVSTVNQTLLTVKKSDKGGKSSFPQFYKYGLAPRQIFLPAASSDVKVELTELKKCLEDLERDRRWLKKGKRPNYCDTFALRYQKGVI